METAPHYDFEHIDSMSEEFNRFRPDMMTPELESHWKLRIQLAIAQQLSVISATLKAMGQKP